MDLSIVTVTGNRFAIRYDPNDTVKILGQKIMDTHPCILHVRLSFAGRDLEKIAEKIVSKIVSKMVVEKNRKRSNENNIEGNKYPTREEEISRLTIQQLGIQQGSNLILDTRMIF